MDQTTFASLCPHSPLSTASSTEPVAWGWSTRVEHIRALHVCPGGPLWYTKTNKNQSPHSAAPEVVGPVLGCLDPTGFPLKSHTPSHTPVRNHPCARLTGRRWHPTQVRHCSERLLLVRRGPTMADPVWFVRKVSC